MSIKFYFKFEIIWLLFDFVILKFKLILFTFLIFMFLIFNIKEIWSDWELFLNLSKILKSPTNHQKLSLYSISNTSINPHEEYFTQNLRYCPIFSPINLQNSVNHKIICYFKVRGRFLCKTLSTKIWVVWQ